MRTEIQKTREAARQEPWQKARHQARHQARWHDTSHGTQQGVRWLSGVLYRSIGWRVAGVAIAAAGLLLGSALVVASISSMRAERRLLDDDVRGKVDHVDQAMVASYASLVKLKSFPTRYEPGAGLVIPTRSEPGGGERVRG